MEQSSSPRYPPPLCNDLVPKTIDPIRSFSTPRTPNHPMRSDIFSPFDDISETESETSSIYTYSKRRPKSHHDLLNLTVLKQSIDSDLARCSRSQRNPRSNSKYQHPETVHGLESVVPIDGIQLTSHAELEQYCTEKKRRLGIPRRANSPAQGSTINPYPYPERHYDIVSAIATADRAFENAHVAKDFETTKSIEANRPAETSIDVAPAERRHDPKAVLVPVEVDDLVRTEGQKDKPAHPCGDGVGQYTAGNGFANSFGQIGNLGGSTRPPNRGGYGCRRNQDDPDPGDSPLALGSPISQDPRRFPCVFHHPDDPRRDLTLHCKTFQKYVSHLRVHHGGNKHAFFYCTTCMTRFATEALREAHDQPLRCKNHKCVTGGCSNFGTHNTANCNHAGRGRENSQSSIWNALRHLAHAFVHTSSLDVGSEASHSEETDFGECQATPGMATSLQTPIAIGSSSTRNHLSSHAQIDRCENQLRMFTHAMLSYLDQPEPESLDMLHDMHNAYMLHDFSSYVECLQPLDRRTGIKGLLCLNTRLWNVVKPSDGAKQSYVRMLRAWAEQVLSSHETPSNSSDAAEPEHSRIDEQDSPTEAAAERRFNDKQRQMEPQINSNVVYGAHYLDSSLLAAPSIGDVNNIDHESFNQSTGQMMSNYINPRHIHDPRNASGAVSYYPFTQRDSAAAIRTPVNNQRNRRTTDSGYSTADRSNNFNS